MILKDKKILIMGIRNKWSIAYGAAQSAYEQGAKLIFTFMGEENRAKIEELISEFEGSKAYELDASNDDAVKTMGSLMIPEKVYNCKEIVALNERLRKEEFELHWTKYNGGNSEAKIYKEIVEAFSIYLSLYTCLYNRQNNKWSIFSGFKNTNLVGFI